MFGSADIEESTTISYSVALNSDPDGHFGSPRQIGTYSFLGVPLYDSLQGTGNRLPYQSSWAQSPEWPLRFVLDKTQYLLMRVFFASLLVMLTALTVCRTWRPHVTTLQQLTLGFLLLAPVGVFLRFYEWYDAYTMTTAVTGIIFLLLRRCNFTIGEGQIDTLFRSRTDYLLLFGCLTILISGHPGVWPLAVFAIVPVMLAAVCLSSAFRERLRLTLRFEKGILMTILIPSAVIVGIVIWELVSESLNQSDWSSDRREHVQGFAADQALRGFTRGLLPDFLERNVSVVIAMVLLPLIRLLFHYLPQSDFSSRMTGAFPQGEFAGLLALGAAVLSWKRIRCSTPEGMLLRVVTIGQIVCIWLAIAAANGLLPLTITPSGTWIMFPILISLNVLVSYVLLGSRKSISSLSVTLAWTNLFLTGLWVVMQLSFVQIASGIRLTTPSRENRTELSERDTAEAEPLLATKGRMLFLQSGEYDLQTPWEDYIKIVQVGKPVVVPATPKIRNINQLIRHSPTKAFITSFRWSTGDVVGLDRLLDFLDVEHVLVEASDPISGAVADFADRANQTISRSDSVETMVFSGADYILWSRTHFSLRIIPEDVMIGRERCPTLESDCPVVSDSIEAFPSPTPRLTVCENPCLWTFSTGQIAPGETLVVPVTYSDTLIVAGTDGGEIHTLDVGGFLGVKSDSGVRAGRYELTIEPDLRMYARVFASYLYTGCFLFLLFITVSRRKLWRLEAVAS